MQAVLAAVGAKNKAEDIRPLWVDEFAKEKRNEQLDELVKSNDKLIHYFKNKTSGKRG